MTAFYTFFRRCFLESAQVFWTLVKVMIPVMILVRLIVIFGGVDLLAQLFAPLMQFAGLPSETGLVWASACLVNIYGGIAALLGLLPGLTLSVAQVTVLGSMILIAHALPVEQRICQKAGASLVFTTSLRLVAALLYGAFLNWTYHALDWLQEPADLSWLPAASPETGWRAWGLASLESLMWIFVIIFALIVLLRTMDRFGVTNFLSRLLQPLLRLMGISSNAMPLTMVGTLLGLSYGGGLIVKEVEAGHLSDKDIILSLCFMSLCHSLIEDSLLMIALGGHWSGLVLGRFVFALLLIALLARLFDHLPPHWSRRLFFSRQAQNNCQNAAAH